MRTTANMYSLAFSTVTVDELCKSHLPRLDSNGVENKGLDFDRDEEMKSIDGNSINVNMF